jgi:hypothetical protein
VPSAIGLGLIEVGGFGPGFENLLENPVFIPSAAAPVDTWMHSASAQKKAKSMHQI